MSLGNQSPYFSVRFGNIDVYSDLFVVRWLYCMFFQLEATSLGDTIDVMALANMDYESVNCLLLWGNLLEISYLIALVFSRWRSESKERLRISVRKSFIAVNSAERWCTFVQAQLQRSRTTSLGFVRAFLCADCYNWETKRKFYKERSSFVRQCIAIQFRKPFTSMIKNCDRIIRT